VNVGRQVVIGEELAESYILLEDSIACLVQGGFV
jgi:hypothetical protein